MCEIMERIAWEEREEGRIECLEEIAGKMLNAGKTMEEIELFTGLTRKELENLKEEIIQIYRPGKVFAEGKRQ